MNASRRIASLPMTAAERRAVEMSPIDTTSLVLASFTNTHQPVKENGLRRAADFFRYSTVSDLVAYGVLWVGLLTVFTTLLLNHH